jgi:UDP-2,3-diacylglucosamine hydrolase
VHLFVSDLHLTAERPEANERFFGFMEGKARGAAALYVLGDLFEVWIGDDDGAGQFNRAVIDAFARVTKGGTALYLMHGNRDFLLGSRFCQATGASLLEDPTVVDIDGTPTVLLHGDTLCTDDVDYQAWRWKARNRLLQRIFLAMSLDMRRRISVKGREKSKAVIAGKPAGIMDVNNDAVRQAFLKHGVTRMIHGHTHRPGHHEMVVDGRRCERWVLPDWYSPGGYLEIRKDRVELVRF